VRMDGGGGFYPRREKKAGTQPRSRPFEEEDTYGEKSQRTPESTNQRMAGSLFKRISCSATVSEHAQYRHHEAFVHVC
jgi:hypothetical protein